MTWAYPLAIPTITPEAIDAATEVMRSGHTTMGAKVEEFEEAFARYVGAPHAVMVNSGSSANLLAAHCVDTQKEVIVPAVTWPTQVWPWEQSGATVKFCDVDGINATQATLEAAITSRTRVVSLVHLMGLPSYVWEKKEAYQGNLIWHEDCCEALGARYAWDNRHVGYYADVATYSFFFSHQLSTMEGGMLTTIHPDWAKQARAMRSHGWTRHFNSDRYSFDREGYNLRPTEVAAAIGLVQLRHLDQFNTMRTRNYEQFERILRGHENVKLPTVPEGVTPSWFGVPMMVENGRDELAKYLESCGIETRPMVAGNLKNQHAFKGFWFGKTPGADLVEAQGLCVGLHPTLVPGAADVARIIGSWS